MEVLLDWISYRALAAVGALVILVFAADRYGGYPIQWYDRWRHPPVGAAVGGEDIKLALEQEQSVRLHSLYQRVSREIAAAEAQKLDVAGLQASADALLAFDKPRYRVFAIERLNKLRMAIPQRSEAARPASLEEAADDEIPTPQATSAGKRRR
jgi:hypothetical protein